MFEQFRANQAKRRQERNAARARQAAFTAFNEAQRHYELDLSAWQQHRDGTQHLIDVTLDPSLQHLTTGLVLNKNELLIGVVEGTSLVEDRSVGGHYSGGSQGISIPIGSIAGRSVRYRVGKTSGHYVAGTPTPTAIDTGQFVITDQRFVFIGAKSTKECRFDKLVSLNRDDQGNVSIGVSNRQKNTVVHYGARIVPGVNFWIDQALAHYHGELDQFVDNLRQQLREIEAAKPTPPTAPALPTT